MKSRIVGALAVLAIAGLAACTPPPPAQNLLPSKPAPRPTCVTPDAYLLVNPGDTLIRAEEIWGPPFRTLSYGSQGNGIDWIACVNKNLLVSGLFNDSSGAMRMADKLPYPTSGSGEAGH